MFVSGTDAHGGAIFKLTWDAKQSIFASRLVGWNLAFDSAGDLFFVDYEVLDHDGVLGNAAIYKITPNGTLTIFASRLSYRSNLASDKAGNLFVSDYDQGIIYKYKPTGSRVTFATGLHHPTGLAFDSMGNLFAADNSVRQPLSRQHLSVQTGRITNHLCRVGSIGSPSGPGLRQYG